MARLSGKNGDIKIGGTRIGISKCSADYNVPKVVCTNSLDAGFENSVDGTKSVSGSFEGFYDTAVNNGLQPPCPLDHELPATFHIDFGDPTTGGTQSWEFSGAVSKLTLAVDVNGAVTFSGDFYSRGAITIIDN